MTNNYLDKLFIDGPRDARPAINDENPCCWLIGRNRDGRLHWRDILDTREGALQFFRRHFDPNQDLAQQMDMTGRVIDADGRTWEVVPDMEYDSDNDRRLTSEPAR